MVNDVASLPCASASRTPSSRPSSTLAFATARPGASFSTNPRRKPCTTRAAECVDYSTLPQLVRSASSRHELGARTPTSAAQVRGVRVRPLAQLPRRSLSPPRSRRALSSTCSSGTMAKTLRTSPPRRRHLKPLRLFAETTMAFELSLSSRYPPPPNSLSRFACVEAAEADGGVRLRALRRGFGGGGGGLERRRPSRATTAASRFTTFASRSSALHRGPPGRPLRSKSPRPRPRDAFAALPPRRAASRRSRPSRLAALRASASVAARSSGLRASPVRRRSARRDELESPLGRANPGPLRRQLGPLRVPTACRPHAKGDAGGAWPPPRACARRGASASIAAA